MWSYLIVGVAGAAIGSFLNVCISRLPEGKSIARPPSHCDSCGHQLGLADLIPIVSFLVLRGKCRYCGAKISWRFLAIEALTALLFLLTFVSLVHSPAPDLLSAVARALFICVFIIIGMIDLETGYVLPVIVYPALLVALVLDIFLPGVGILGGLLGAAVGLVFLLVPFLVARYVFHRDGMGVGDLMIAGLIGAVTGFPNVLVALLAGTVLGAVTAVVLLAIKRKGRHDPVPFGPFLAAGTLVTLFFGGQITHWYLGFFA